MRVGVLALQGDFREHQSLLERLGVEAIKVRKPEDLESISGLVIPGGESTTISKLAQIYGLIEPIRAFLAAGKPVLGTCAGLIMLSNEVGGAGKNQMFFGGLDISVDRNAYGAQSNSFEADVEIGGLSQRVAFIRAPKILAINASQVQVLASFRGEPVAVRQGNIIGASFHPEITGATKLHEIFLQSI